MSSSFQRQDGASIPVCRVADVLGQWRPIETAPHDARVTVLLIGRYPNGNGWSDIYQGWSQPPYGKGWATHWARWPHSFPPTHWMPSPANPDATPETKAAGYEAACGEVSSKARASQPAAPMEKG
jgi:hypothetical protein